MKMFAKLNRILLESINQAVTVCLIFHLVRSKTEEWAKLFFYGFHGIHLCDYFLPSKFDHHLSKVDYLISKSRYIEDNAVCF